MDCTTISYPDLALATAANAADELTIVVAGQPKRITVGALLAAVQSDSPGEVTFNGTGTFIVPAGKLLQHIALTTNTTNTVLIGTSSGGNQIDENEVTGGVAYTLSYASYFSTNQTIHFTGNATAKIYFQ
jgi:hypothetical protein